MVLPKRSAPLAQSTTELHYVTDGVVEEAVAALDEDDEIDAAPASDAIAPIDPLADMPPAADVPPPAARPSLSLFGRRESKASQYDPISADLAELVVTGQQGLVWHAQILADDYSNPKHVLPSGELKPRRPMPQARASAFFNSLVQTKEGRWIFGGVLNGWPGLTRLELRGITARSRDRVLRLKGVRRLFDAATKQGSVPRGEAQLRQFCDKWLSQSSVRVTLRAPDWTGRGWSAESPGHVFWFDALGPVPRVVHGTALLTACEGQRDPIAKRVSMFGHRYAKVRESTQDRLTWHAAALVEWDHGHFVTVVELAWLNGLGGYGGKSNFVLDRDSERPELYNAIPPPMKAPWHQARAEIRLIDMPLRDLTAFKAFLQEYTGRTKRFLEPAVSHTADVRLSGCSRSLLFAQLVNYSLRNPRYTQESRNCQTFACDLFRHLSGNFKAEPFHPINRPLYVCRSHDFLYTADPAQGQ
jgi:hypothetical protein